MDGPGSEDLGSFLLAPGPVGDGNTHTCCRLKLSLRWAVQGLDWGGEVGTHRRATDPYNNTKCDMLSGGIFVSYMICGTQYKMKISKHFKMAMA